MRFTIDPVWFRTTQGVVRVTSVSYRNDSLPLVSLEADDGSCARFDLKKRRVIDKTWGHLSDDDMSNVARSIENALRRKKRNGHI